MTDPLDLRAEALRQLQAAVEHDREEYGLPALDELRSRIEQNAPPRRPSQDFGGALE